MLLSLWTTTDASFISSLHFFFFLLLLLFPSPPPLFLPPSLCLLLPTSVPLECPLRILPTGLGLATRWPHLGIVNLIAYSRTPLLNKVTLEDSRIWGMGRAFQRALQSTATLDPWQLASTDVPETNESWALRNWLSQLPWTSMDVMVEPDEEQKERLNTKWKRTCRRGSWGESCVHEVL